MRAALVAALVLAATCTPLCCAFSTPLLQYAPRPLRSSPAQFVSLRESCTQNRAPARQSRQVQLAMMDFDAIRTSLRFGIRTFAALGGAAAVGALLKTSLQRERLSLDVEGISEFVSNLSAEEWKMLVVCLSLDLVGAMPELLVAPPLGDTVDAFWAPVYAFILFQLFGDKSFVYKTTLAASGFLEEALPFVSLIPSATIGWLVQHNTDKAARIVGESLQGKARSPVAGQGSTGKRAPEDR